MQYDLKVNIQSVKEIKNAIVKNERKHKKIAESELKNEDEIKK